MNIFNERIYLYEIECEVADHVYVGISAKVGRRYYRHVRGKGANFTKVYGVKSIKIISDFETKKEAQSAERNHVLYLQEKYPNKRIAGAGWLSTI